MRPRAPSPGGMVLVAAALTLAVAPLAAQVELEPPRLTLHEAARQALASHPSTRAAQARQDAASAGLAEARAARLPSLTLSATATRYSDPMLVAPLHGLTPGTSPAFDETLLQGGAAVAYTLYDGGARGARIRQARANAAADAAAVEATTHGLLARVAAVYLDGLARARILAAHDQRLAALDAEHQRVTRLFTEGRVAEVERRRSQAALAEARAERTRHAAALEVARHELARLTGASGEPPSPLTDLRLRDSGAVPDRPALLDAALAASPAVTEARHRRQAAEAGVAIARGGRWPELRAVGGYLRRGSGSSGAEDEWNAGLQLSYPIFNGGATGHRVARAAAGKLAAGEELRLTEFQIAEQLDAALAETAEADAQLMSRREAVEAFVEVARAERLRLEVGAGTQTDYLTAEAELLSARAQLVQTEYRRIAARVETARLTGRLDLAWLAETLESQP